MCCLAPPAFTSAIRRIWRSIEVLVILPPAISGDITKRFTKTQLNCQ